MFIFDNYNGVQFIPNINFVSSLNHQSVNVYIVNKSLKNVLNNQTENNTFK